MSKENIKYGSKDLEFLKAVHASNKTLSETFSAKDAELINAWDKGNKTQAKLEALISHKFSAKANVEEKFQYTLSSVKEIAEFNKNSYTVESQRTWGDWALDHAIPTTLALIAGAAGGYMIGKQYAQLTQQAKPASVPSKVADSSSIMVDSTNDNNRNDFQSPFELKKPKIVRFDDNSDSSSEEEILDYGNTPPKDHSPSIASKTPGVTYKKPESMTPFTKEQLKSISNAAKSLVESDNVSEENVQNDIIRFVTKFQDAEARGKGKSAQTKYISDYNYNHLKILDHKLTKFFKGHTYAKEKLYTILENVFHFDTTLNRIEGELNFYELFEHYKASQSDEQFSEASKIFGLNEKALKSIFKYKDSVDTAGNSNEYIKMAYMAYLGEVIVAGFIATNLPQANAEELKFNETVYALDEDLSDESDDIILEEVDVSSVKETFVEKLQDKLPEYAEIITANFASGALTTVNYISAIAVLEAFYPGISGMFPAGTLGSVISELTHQEIDNFSNLFFGTEV